jgi:hypothetical protein
LHGRAAGPRFPGNSPRGRAMLPMSIREMEPRHSDGEGMTREERPTEPTQGGYDGKGTEADGAKAHQSQGTGRRPREEGAPGSGRGSRRQCAQGNPCGVQDRNGRRVDLQLSANQPVPVGRLGEVATTSHDTGRSPSWTGRTDRHDRQATRERTGGSSGQDVPGITSRDSHLGAPRNPPASAGASCPPRSPGPG